MLSHQLLRLALHLVFLIHNPLHQSFYNFSHAHICSAIDYLPIMLQTGLDVLGQLLIARLFDRLRHFFLLLVLFLSLGVFLRRLRLFWWHRCYKYYGISK